MSRNLAQEEEVFFDSLNLMQSFLDDYGSRYSGVFIYLSGNPAKSADEGIGN
jgi:hypothetical protein